MLTRRTRRKVLFIAAFVFQIVIVCLCKQKRQGAQLQRYQILIRRQLSHVLFSNLKQQQTFLDEEVVAKG